MRGRALALGSRQRFSLLVIAPRHHPSSSPLVIAPRHHPSSSPLAVAHRRRSSSSPLAVAPRHRSSPSVSRSRSPIAFGSRRLQSSRSPAHLRFSRPSAAPGHIERDRRTRGTTATATATATAIATATATATVTARLPLRVLRGLGTDSTAPAIASERLTGGQCGASTGTRTRPSVRHGAVGDSTATSGTLDRGGGWGPLRRGFGGEAPNVTRVNPWRSARAPRGPASGATPPRARRGAARDS